MNSPHPVVISGCANVFCILYNVTTATNYDPYENTPKIILLANFQS